ncbi:MAG TPA: restriction endonuclease [Candidatus Baltobacteraceae bacterium]|nr:restriction endonuclease [Candidatus Baltobacteraceae bacterium]
MSVWLVRAGRYGEREDFALEKNVSTIGWSAMPDLAPMSSRGEVRTELELRYSAESAGTISNWTGQLWRFAKEIAEGDVIAMPLKNRPFVQFGTVTGPYKYEPKFPEDAHHSHTVKWVREVARASIDQDLLFSLGSTMTVAKIERNDAERRFRQMMEGSPAPSPSPRSADEAPQSFERTDVEEIGLDAIRTHIKTKFAGHRLARLVEGVLIAQGYATKLSPPGSDGGVDVLAGRGPLGTDSPRLCVQVKSGDTPVDVKILRELKGTVDNFKADIGLLVSFAGFRSSIPLEANHDHFKIRLWNDVDLMKAITENYDRLPEDLKADLPLRRVWTLAVEE